MKGHLNFVWTVGFSPNGSRIASGSTDTIIRIWDVQTGKEMHKLDGHTGQVNSVAFSPDSKWIASASDDNTVRVWTSESGQQVGLPLTGHTEWVSSITFSTDGHQIISGSYDRTIRVWPAPHERQQITAIHLSQRPASTPAGRIQLEGHPSVLSACRSPDKSLYAASTLEGRVSIWNVEPERPELLWEANTSVHPIHLLRFSETQLILSALDGTSLTWNLLDGKPANEEAITRGPQLIASGIHQSTGSANDSGISWIPFGFDSGLWAYVDGCLIRFEGEEKSVTFIDIEN
jgi:WD40 repeat protein